MKPEGTLIDHNYHSAKQRFINLVNVFLCIRGTISIVGKYKSFNIFVEKNVNLININHICEVQ